MSDVPRDGSTPVDQRFCYQCAHSAVCEHWVKARRIMQAELPVFVGIERSDFSQLANLLARKCSYYERRT